MRGRPTGSPTCSPFLRRGAARPRLRPGDGTGCFCACDWPACCSRSMPAPGKIPGARWPLSGAPDVIFFNRQRQRLYVAVWRSRRDRRSSPPRPWKSLQRSKPRRAPPYHGALLPGGATGSVSFCLARTAPAIYEDVMAAMTHVVLHGFPSQSLRPPSPSWC